MTRLLVLGDQITSDVLEDCYIVELTEEELVETLNGKRLKDILPPERFVPIEDMINNS